MSFVVGIDGPAGTGKSTVTKILADELNLINIDTGATYRCVALKTLEKNVKIDDKEEIIKISEEINIEFVQTEKEQLVFLDGENVTNKIRSAEVTKIVSPISSIKEVRLNMVKLQRKLAEGKNVIMEGRDITTYVFPNADVKIYLDADLEVRAKRRFEQNKEKNIKMTYEEILENITKRDENDKNKPIGSLKIAEDAIVIDNTNMGMEEMKEKIKQIILEKLQTRKGE